MGVEFSSCDEILEFLENFEEKDPKNDFLTPSLTLFLLGIDIGLAPECNVEGELGVLPGPVVGVCGAGVTGFDDDLNRPNLNNFELEEGGVPEAAAEEVELTEVAEVVDALDPIEELLFEGKR